MNILIVTGNFGQGHMSAANALRQELTDRDPENNVVIVDIVRYLFPRLSGLVYGTFNIMAKHFSGLYNMLNRVDEHTTVMPMKGWFIGRFQKLVDACEPGLMISTLPIGSRYIGTYKSCTGSKIPYVTCITDIFPHEEWISPIADAYLVGDAITKEELVKKGVDPETIYVGGIPVRKEFSDIRAADCRTSGGPEKTFLIMGGGLGLIPGIGRLLDILSEKSDVRVTIITGKNADLKRRLEAAYPGMYIKGYVESPAEYFKKADWIITKAGGITTFESIVSGTPMLIIPPFLEQERENADYIVRRGIGVVLDRDPGTWERRIEELTGDDALRGEIIASMREIRSETCRNGISLIIDRLEKGKELNSNANDRRGRIDDRAFVFGRPDGAYPFAELCAVPQKAR